MFMATNGNVLGSLIVFFFFLNKLALLLQASKNRRVGSEKSGGRAPSMAAGILYVVTCRTISYSG